MCSPLLSSPLPPHPHPPPPPDVGPQIFGSEEEEVGLDSGVGDSDKVDSEAAPEETNSKQVLDLLNLSTLYLLHISTKKLSFKIMHRVTVMFTLCSAGVV